MVASGFITPDPDAAEPAVQTIETLWYLRFFDVAIPIMTSAIALVIMWSYEISETRANEIRRELEARRSANAGERESNENAEADVTDV